MSQEKKQAMIDEKTQTSPKPNSTETELFESGSKCLSLSLARQMQANDRIQTPKKLEGLHGIRGEWASAAIIFCFILSVA